MKRLNWIPGLLLLSLLGCQGHMEYDTERLDPEVTLFEKGLVVPVGSAGPFSMELALEPIVNFLGNPRFALAVNPLNWLDLTGNIGWSSYGLTWGAAAQVRIYRFRLHAGMQNGFGGTLPYKSTPLKANAKTLVVGLTFDL